MKEYIDQTFVGKGIEVTEDSLFLRCKFKDISKSDDWCGDGICCHMPYSHGTPEEGPSVNVIIKECEFDNSGVDPEDCDEAVSGFLNGTKIYMENTTIRNWGKGILMGNGDWTKEQEGDLLLVCENCTFENVGRRHPFIRYGTAHLRNCTFKNWGSPNSYEVKGNCIKAILGARVILENCKFIQDKFHFELGDFLHQFDPSDVYDIFPEEKGYFFKLVWNIIKHPIKFFRAWKPGCVKALELDTGATAKIGDGVEKNKRWIHFDKWS